MAVTERLLAIQGQDPRGARLAIRARSAGLTAADVDRALTHDRSLIITWLNRGTLHLIRSEDYWWPHPLVTPPVWPANARRLDQEGVPPAAPGRDSAGGASAGWDAAARDRALAELARRYLAGHGPAGDRDLAKWAGLPLRDARRGLTAITSQLAERDDGLADLAGLRRDQQLPPTRLLGSFDPLLHGWVSREPVLGQHVGVVTVNGLFRPFILVAGRAAGTWGLRGRAVRLHRFGELREDVEADLAAEAADVVRFLGLT